MYLDNAATTPLLPEVKQTVIRWLDFFGNPSSEHEEGRIVKQRIEDSRYAVAKFIGGNADNVIFTSSGSASNSLVIKGLLDSYIFFYTPTCHKSMRLACLSKPLHQEVKVNNDGAIDFYYLEEKVKKLKGKFVFCYEMVNSELGIAQHNKDIVDLVHKYEGIVVADATAYVPHFQLKANELMADFYTFSAHKIGALKGTGVVYYNCSKKLDPLIYGAQEKGLFGGTENVMGIIALGKACEVFSVENQSQVGILHRYISEAIAHIPDSYEILGSSEYKIPNISMYCFQDLFGDELALLLDEDGFQVSTGSACNSGYAEPSHALIAVGVQKSDAQRCIRISLSGNETFDEINEFIDSLRANVEKLRTFS